MCVQAEINYKEEKGMGWGNENNERVKEELRGVGLQKGRGREWWRGGTCSLTILFSLCLTFWLQLNNVLINSSLINCHLKAFLL